MLAFLTAFLYYGIAPCLCFSFFCRLCSISVPWHAASLYLLLSSTLHYSKIWVPFSGFLLLVSDILCLALLGIGFLSCQILPALSAATLSLSLFCLAAGTSQALEYQMLLRYSTRFPPSLFTFATNLFLVILLFLTFLCILKLYQAFPSHMPHRITFLLMLPGLFAALSSQLLSDTVYGNQIIWSPETGLRFPQNKQQADILVLHLAAYISLFAALSACRLLSKSFWNGQSLRLLEQQHENKKAYLQKAEEHYEKTRSFRHDLKNHLLIIETLLEENQEEEAKRYLQKLKITSCALSPAVRTGSPVMDALLHQKIGEAKHQGIPVLCDIHVPETAMVKDIDWCILLSNSIDNAIHACLSLPKEKRHIRISGTLKGAFYLLTIENSCPKQTAPLVEGIGISNIRVTAKAYQGSVMVKRTGTLFTLQVFLVLPQLKATKNEQHIGSSTDSCHSLQADDISHPID